MEPQVAELVELDGHAGGAGLVWSMVNLLENILDINEIYIYI